MKDPHKQYERLDNVSKRILQVLAFQHGTNRIEAIRQHAKTFDLRQGNGRLVTQSFLSDSLSRFARAGLAYGSSTQPYPELMDLLIREGLFGKFAHELVSLAKSSGRWTSRNPLLDFYLAFYLQDAEAWKTARRDITDGSIPLLSPFCENIFRQLKPQFQEEYFSFVIPAWITSTSSDEKGFQALRKLLDGDAPFSNELMPQLVE